MKQLTLLIFFGILTLVACSKTSIDDTNSGNPMNNDDGPIDTDTTSTDLATLKILSLGDSYTIGQSVCETCRFPAQLKYRLTNSLENTNFSLDIIAQTGWTTSNLLNAIEQQNPEANYDLATLLIGVNNQYQGKPFTLYETEFPQLVDKAIASVGGDTSNLIVVSIPDYAYTPFGQGTQSPQTISDEIDHYNNFAQNYCEQNGITFVNITDITRSGLNNPDLVASDGLHPSELAYSQFVVRLLPLALEKIQ